MIPATQHATLIQLWTKFNRIYYAHIHLLAYAYQFIQQQDRFSQSKAKLMEWTKWFKEIAHEKIALFSYTRICKVLLSTYRDMVSGKNIPNKLIG